MIEVIGPGKAKALVHAGAEVAFLDVREAADYGDGHPLFVVHCPYSRIEVEAVRLVPDPDVPLLLIDGGDGIARRAAERLDACGYRDIRVIEGGVPAWRAAGFGVFAGVNVPSKTLGEIAEHDHHPDMIDPQTLHQWRSEGRRFHFFDTRPPAEYGKMRIPGARCLPNGELAHRLDAVVSDESTPILVTCAGRTRGIVGALGLRALGIRNPVYALRNGTQGWALADFTLERGASADPFPELDGKARAASRARAARLKEGGVSFVPAARAAQMYGEGGRASFLFDLRTSEERDRRPCPGAVPVLGGQLVQATDLYVGVRHARLILIDDTGLRGALAALWLNGLGFEAHVVALDEESAAPDIRRDRPAPVPPAPPGRISVAQAIDALKHPATALFDLRPSNEHEAGHPRGAVWSIRPRLPRDIPAGAEVVILFGDRGAVTGAGVDLAGSGRRVFWLDAGLSACAGAGWPVETSAPMDRRTAVDRVWFVHDRHDGNRAASLRYLAWETGLVAELDADERAEFRPIRLPE